MIVETFKYDNSDPIQLVFTECVTGDVDMGEFRVSSDKLLTMGVLTCIVLAAHNEETKRGLVGHYTDIANPRRHSGSDRPQFHAALREIAQLGDPLSTGVFIGGGTPHQRGGIDAVAPERAYAEKRVRALSQDFRLPGDQVVVEWSDPDRAVDVELDCTTGILVVHNSPRDTLGMVPAPAEVS